MYRGEFNAPEKAAVYKVFADVDKSVQYDLPVTEPKIEPGENALNQELLESLAKSTGGKFVREEALYTLPDQIKAEAPKVITNLEVEFWTSPLYYALMLLDGGRRQIVQTFAVLILVKEFGVELRSVAALLLVNNLLTMVASPIVGRWTDRFGERRVLSCYYLLVMAVFFTYTRIPMLASLTGLGPVSVFCVVFALDNLLFTGSVGIQTYIRHTAPRSELSASLAMGLTWNHISAVTVPLAAGWIWAHYGYQRIFLYGIALALASFCLCTSLPGKGKSETQRDTGRRSRND